MIEIDDSGSGSLIGGTCIALYNTETDTFYHEIIPVSLYDEINFPKKLYLSYVTEIVHRGFLRLGVTAADTICICRGYMFDLLRKWLTENGYTWESVKITGKLQEYVEAAFENYTVTLGFPQKYITYTKYPFHFHRILRWVYADYENRRPLCKVGWKSFRQYGSLKQSVSCENVPKQGFVCLKCGKVLRKNTKALVLRYETNKPNIIYLHQGCYTGTSARLSCKSFETPCSCMVTPYSISEISIVPRL